MNTDKFAETLLHAIKQLLSGLGVPARTADRLDTAIYLTLILLLALVAGRLVRAATHRTIRRMLRKHQSSLLSDLVKGDAATRFSHMIPPLVVAGLLPFAFPHATLPAFLLERMAWVLFFLFLSLFLNAFLSSAARTVEANGMLRGRPVKGFVQVVQVALSCVMTVIIISTLLDKSPLHLITGLGAFAAVLMLVFKDTILGFVAGVLLSKNDMVRLGDWIEMEGGVNGIVIDISLTIVKVQNFDNTIVTIPPYSLVSKSFVNWRGMSESGGRRIMRQYELKLDYIKPCTPEFLERMKHFDPGLADYITRKQVQAAEGKVANTENPDGLVNGTIDTNAGLLRAYMTLYLKRHPAINQELLVMVRTLAPTPNGLPVQLWCFSANKVWPSYESIQAEIMEHFVSVLPVFELYPFQNASARDYIVSGLLEAGTPADRLYGIPWHTLRPAASDSPAKEAILH